MAKQVISVRLAQSELEALDHFASVLPASRAKVLESILQNFFERDFLEQSAIVRSALRSPRPGGARGG